MAVPDPERSSSSHVLGDLFTPTIVRPTVAGDPPYRAGSLIFPAFFGGPFGMLPFALRNARRYGFSPAQRRQVLLAITTSFLGSVVAAVLLELAGGPERATTLSVQVFGLLAYMWVSRMFRGPERRAELLDVEFDRFGFWRGLLAALFFSILGGLVIVGVVGLL